MLVVGLGGLAGAYIGCRPVRLIFQINMSTPCCLSGQFRCPLHGVPQLSEGGGG